MRKKLFQVISCLLISIILTGSILFCYEKYLDSAQQKTTYNSAVGRTYGNSKKDKGITLLQRGSNEDNLLIFGSSELGSNVPQNPKNMFPNTELNCNVNIIGDAYVQDLLNTIKVGALSDSLKNKKIVVIVSIQWFMQWLPFLGNEIDVNGYNSNFSELQFYRLMQNPNLSSDIKKYICTRTFELSKGESSLERSNIFSYLYSKNNFLSNSALTVLKPYYSIREKFLSLKDKHQGLEEMNKFQYAPIQKTKQINWSEEEIEAQKMGQAACTNNKFYIEDDYYSANIKPQLDHLKNSNSNTNLLNSNELKDYEIFLKTCQELNIRPYIIFMPTNGFYYDYTGLSAEKRYDFYNFLESKTDEYGFDYLDMRDKEYEPYFLKDIMHLGWKGWLYVDKKITQYYS